MGAVANRVVGIGGTVAELGFANQVRHLNRFVDVGLLKQRVFVVGNSHVAFGIGVLKREHELPGQHGAQLVHGRAEEKRLARSRCANNGNKERLVFEEKTR